METQRSLIIKNFLWTKK